MSHRFRRGFTLIEVLVAFALTVTLLSVVLPEMSGLSRRQSLEAQRSTASLHLHNTLVVIEAGDLNEQRQRYEFEVGWYVETEVLLEEQTSGLGLYRISLTAFHAGREIDAIEVLRTQDVANG